MQRDSPDLIACIELVLVEINEGRRPAIEPVKVVVEPEPIVEESVAETDDTPADAPVAETDDDEREQS